MEFSVVEKNKYIVLVKASHNGSFFLFGLNNKRIVVLRKLLELIEREV